MKHSTQLIRSLLGLTVLLASCQVDDSLDILSDSEAQLFVSEACNYYYQKKYEYAEKTKLLQKKKIPCQVRASEVHMHEAGVEGQNGVCQPLLYGYRRTEPVCRDHEDCAQ